jgi:hypothetical protein
MSLNLIEAMEHPGLFEPWFPGPTWGRWKAILKASAALPLTDDELAFFRSMAERDPPPQPVRELWLICGRRAGKDSVASGIVAHSAATFDDHDRLRPGERALACCIACDRDQSKIGLGYTRSYFTKIGELDGAQGHCERPRAGQRCRYPDRHQQLPSNPWSLDPNGGSGRGGVPA